MTEQCAGQLAFPLWESLHPCPVCEVDRLALGHYWSELPAHVPYSVDDLLQHLGSCNTGRFADEVSFDAYFDDEWPEPF